jgi:predicted esterase YcpF (UPF0227 family)
MPRSILYIHGFLSSPQSEKAQQTLAYAQAQGDTLMVPALPTNPTQALALLEGIMQEQRPQALIGSSLGGFFATILAEKYGLRAALINPAVEPYKRLAPYIGPVKNYHTGEVSVIDESFMDDLLAMESRPRNLHKIAVFLETGDETLDYRDALAYYAGALISVTEGGSHRYEGFQEKLPAIWQFLSNV